jgi:hypothetical protein
MSQYLIIYSADVKYSHQDFVVDNGLSMMQFYNNTFKLGLDMTYIDFNTHFNYSNTFWNMNIIQDTLFLSSINEKLKKFNQNKYEVLTSNPFFSHYESNY